MRLRGLVARNKPHHFGQESLRCRNSRTSSSKLPGSSRSRYSIHRVRTCSASGSPREATQLLVERLQLPPDVAAKSYALAIDPVDGMARDAKFDMEGFRNMLKLRGEIEGQWGGTPPSPEKYIDLSYHAKALARL
jgi:hypothetical protein